MGGGGGVGDLMSERFSACGGGRGAGSVIAFLLKCLFFPVVLAAMISLCNIAYLPCTENFMLLCSVNSLCLQHSLCSGNFDHIFCAVKKLKRRF